MFDSFNFGKNVSNIYINFDYDAKKKLKQQKHVLSEDILQVTYTNGYIIDIGWYPAFDLHGNFKIVLSKDMFDNVIFQYNCKNINELKKALQTYIDIANNFRG